MTVAMPIYRTVKISKKDEGKDLKESESGVMRFMRCERGGGVVYILPRCLLITGWLRIILEQGMAGRTSNKDTHYPRC